jgi:hypothetical protein
MDIALIVSGIRAVMRAAQAGIDIHVEHTVDSPIFLPNIRLPPLAMADTITNFLRNQSEWQSTVPFEAGWHTGLGVWNPTSVVNKQDCIAIYLQESSAADLDGRSDEEKNQLIGGRMIEQWRFDKKPPSAWAKVALSLTDIALEFVATNPSIMGEQSKGELLVVAFAKSLSDLIPDDVDEMGTAHDFGNRLLGVFLRAGLATILDDKDTLIKDQNVKALVNGIIKPIGDELPTDFSEQVRYRALVETLMSDSAAAAFAIVAENPNEYLGDRFINDKALGAVTKALLATTAKATADKDILAVFSEQGAKLLFNSALTVAIEQPKLFIDENTGSDNHQLLIDLFVGTAQSLKTANIRGFSKEMGTSFAAMVVATVGQHATVLLKLDPSSPWEKVAISLIQDITGELSEAIATNGRFQLLSQEQQHKFGEVILQQIAATPSMLGVHNPELKNVITGVAQAMAADDKFLVSNEEWIQIAAVAAQVAATNPARLFNIDADSEGKKLGLVAIKTILNVASESLGAAGDTQLRGYTLSASITIVLDALSGNIKAAVNNPQLLDDYFSTLLQNTVDHPEKWGSKTILDFVSDTIETVLADGILPSFE